MVYQDLITKFCLWALTEEGAPELAFHLFGIFSPTLYLCCVAVTKELNLLLNSPKNWSFCGLHLAWFMEKQDTHKATALPDEVLNKRL